MKPLERLRLSQTNRPIDTLLYWKKEQQLNLSPPYQRGDVWGYRRRQNLIRSILLGVPIPSIIINDRFAANWKDDESIVVIDGKQRITAVLDFLNDDLTVPAEWFGVDSFMGLVVFSDLTPARQRYFRQFPLPFTEGQLGSLEAETEVFDLVNFGGVPQGESDLTPSKSLSEKLLELAIKWNSEASQADAAGNADCGTGSDVPYAAAAMLREHAGEIETLAFAKK